MEIARGAGLYAGPFKYELPEVPRLPRFNRTKQHHIETLPFADDSIAKAQQALDKTIEECRRVVERVCMNCLCIRLEEIMFANSHRLTDDRQYEQRCPSLELKVLRDMTKLRFDDRESALESTRALVQLARPPTLRDYFAPPRPQPPPPASEPPR